MRDGGVNASETEIAVGPLTPVSATGSSSLIDINGDGEGKGGAIVRESKEIGELSIPVQNQARRRSLSWDMLGLFRGREKVMGRDVAMDRIA